MHSRYEKWSRIFLWKGTKFHSKAAEGKDKEVRKTSIFEPHAEKIMWNGIMYRFLFCFHVKNVKKRHIYSAAKSKQS